MKHISILSILVSLVLILSACQPGIPATEAAPPGSKTIIRLGSGDSGEGLNPHQQIIMDFEAKNPDVLVQLEAVAGNDYYTRLLTQVAAKAAPDLMQIGDDAVPMFVNKGAVIPLDDYIKGSNFDLGIYLPALLEPGKFNGKQYLLPKDYSTLAVYYNKKLFDDAKVSYPKDGWTWDDLLATAQRLTRDINGDGKIDQWGIQLPATWTTGFEYWVAAAGGRLISDDGKSFAGSMDSAEAISAMQFYVDLYNKYRVAPPPADMKQFGGGNSEFKSGKAAMYLFGRWPQSDLKKVPAIDLGVVGVPKGKVRANILFWGGFGIASTAKNPKQAFNFLSYYTGEPGSLVWKDWALPAVKSVAEGAGMTRDAIEGVWINELSYLKPRAYTRTPYWNEAADPALRKALETLLIDPKADVTAMMKQAAKEAQEALDKQAKK